jgi:pimeloyl-ACP methyl ester carboxylesterase
MERIRSLLTVVVVVAATGAACGDDSGTPSTTEAAGPPPTTISPTEDFDGLIDVAGHAVHLQCFGSGAPTVMLELGAGQELSSWNSTLPLMAEGNRACGYERAGTGTSEPGQEPRTSQVIADELSELIANAGLATPIVLVSHSFGGQHSQAFAERHPDEVAGMLFIDPRTAQYQAGYRDNLTPEELELDQRDVEAAVNEPFGPEIAAADDGAAEIVQAGDLPDVPVIVLSADMGYPGQSDVDRAFWLETHENLAAQVSDGQQRVVEGTGHEIWRDDQQAVLDAVAEVVVAVG